MDMTITSIRTDLLRVPWAGEPPANAIMPPTHREFLVVEIGTKGGLSGMGYLQPLSGGLEALDGCMRTMIAPKLLGRDATEIEGIWQTLWSSTYWLGRGGIAVFCLSAVDIALWDILGKRADLPLYRLWGKSRDAVPAYGSGCWRGLGRDGMIAAVADTWGIKIAPHCFHELMVHVAASIPNASYLEYMDWNDDLWIDPAIPAQGMLRPLETPGHGLRFRPEILRDCRVGGFEVSG